MGVIETRLQQIRSGASRWSRRDFLKISGGGALSLSMTQLGGAVSTAFVGRVFAADEKIAYSSTEDLYRDIWKWDKVTWGSHTNVCLPGSCSQARSNRASTTAHVAALFLCLIRRRARIRYSAR